jgi:hypothetical protein
MILAAFSIARRNLVVDGNAEGHGKAYLKEIDNDVAFAAQSNKAMQPQAFGEDIEVPFIN